MTLYVNSVSQKQQYTLLEAPIKSKVHTPYKLVTLEDVANLIKSDTYHIKTQALRNLKTDDEQRKFKARYLDYVLFGGVFSSFNDSALVTTPLDMCIDFDHVDDVKGLQSELLADKYFATKLMFRSPRGEGVKWLIDAKDVILECGYANAYNAVRNYLLQTYSLRQNQVDKACSNISRATFLCEDKDVYYNSYF